MVTLDTYALTSLANAQEYLGVTENANLIIRLINAASAYMERLCSRHFLTREYRQWLDGSGDGYLVLDERPVTAVTRLYIDHQIVVQVKNTSSDAEYANVRVVQTGIAAPTALDLVVGGGENEDSTSLALDTYTTVSTLVGAIAAAGYGWTASAQSSTYDTWLTADLRPTPALQALTKYVWLEMPYGQESDYQYNEDDGVLHLPTGFPFGYRSVFVVYNAGYSTAPADVEQICLELVKRAYDQRKVDFGMQSERIGDYQYTRAIQSVLDDELRAKLAPWRRLF
jgi:hypothetical protein